jgi:FkbM family methyltransferase
MEIRKLLKRWLYGFCPGVAGSFPYFGTSVYFPKGSLSFLEACEQGIFETENVRLLQGLVHPGTWFIDVGANIGLMSAPVLQHVGDARVLALEPSPNVLTYLERTIAGSPYATRWTLVPKAAADFLGHVKFSLSAQENSLFDGIRNTRRVPSAREVEVEVTTIDEEWKGIGSPVISAIKIDVEGAELGALRGSMECLRVNRPAVLLEWNAKNLAAYGCLPETLLSFAIAEGFRLLSLPYLVEVSDETQLRLHMLRTESFLLCPQGERLL